MKLDQITIDRIALLHPKVRDEALAIYQEICTALTGRAFCRFAFTLRTFPEQAELYAQGRTKLYDSTGRKLGKVTNARPGASMHNYGLAIDIVLIVDKDGNGSYESASWDVVADFDGDRQSDWMECVKIFKKHQWSWGGDWKTFVDRPHFERAFGHSWRDLLALHNEKKIDCNGYVEI